VAYSKPDKYGTRHDVWITFTHDKECHDGKAEPRMRLYIGPDRQSKQLPGGAGSVDTGTSIEELGSSTSAMADLSVPALLPWWQDRLNTAQLSTRKVKTKEYREDDDATSRKRRRCDAGASQAEHDTCNGMMHVAFFETVLTDMDIINDFNDLDTPISEFIMHRMGGIMQEQKETNTLPPFDLVRRLRDPMDPTITMDLLLWEVSESPGPLMDGSVAHLSRGQLEDAFRKQEELISRLQACYKKP
jgi:hypothetical protein